MNLLNEENIINLAVDPCGLSIDQENTYLCA